MKGVNKRVIEINRPESEYIEKVLIFLRQKDGHVHIAQARQEAELFARDRDYLCVLTRAQFCAILKMEREHDEAGRTDDSRHGAERAVSESGKRL